MYQPKSNNSMNTAGFEIIHGVISVADAEKYAREALDEMDTREHMSHSDTIWKLRTHPSVLALFRRLWKMEDVVTGFDGIGVSHGDFELPWHVDQERHSDSCVGIQGIMALSRHDAASGGLSLLVGSHLEHSWTQRLVVVVGMMCVGCRACTFGTEVEKADVETIQTNHVVSKAHALRGD